MRGPVLRTHLILVCAGLLMAGRVAAQPSFETVDLMPLYWQFRERAQGRPPDEQVRLFSELVVARRPDVYNAAVLNAPAGTPFDGFLRETYPKATAWTDPHVEVIRTLSKEIATSMPRHVDAFRREFPDFAYAGRVFFMYSLGAFDGAVRTVDGRPALMFGLDVIAAIHGDAATVAPLFHHELFHAYHGPLIGDTGRGLPVYLSVWAEGLATLVARRLNPGASDVAILGLPTNTPRRVRDDLPRLASQLRDRLDSRAPEEYDTWFTGNDTVAEIPRRSGYYLGYLVAARLQQGRSLRELALLKGDALRDAIDRTLADTEGLARVAATEAR